MNIYSIKECLDKREEIFNLLSQLTDSPLLNQSDFNNIVNNLSDKHKIYVYIENNKVLGIITVFIEQKLIHNGSNVAHIEDLVVDNNFKNMGIATKLINYILDNLEYNIYKIILDCKIELKDFYSKFGFENKNIQMAKYI
tara:strand:+ start:2203 stop:2622 length:420 start_codon:yes stop_codon:yes gene_type:complete